MFRYKKHAIIHKTLFISCIAVFGLLFILHSAYMYKTVKGLDTLHLAAFLIGVFIIQMLSYAITALGFLIFGKLSGYKFSFMRIAFMKWQKDKKGKIHFFTTNERGPSAACAMYPPDIKDGKFPYLLFSHGTVILSSVCIIISAIFLAFNFNTPVISSLLLLFIFVLLTFVILDIFVGNAKLARDAKKSPAALRGIWLYCKGSDPEFSSLSLGSLPDEWFDIPLDVDTNIYWASYYIFFASGRLLMKREFEKAIEVFDKLLEPSANIFYIQYLNTVTERLFCELMTNRNPEVIQKLYTDELKRHLSNVRSYTNLCRNYAFTLFIENNPAGAAQIKAEFFEVSKHAPCQGDVQDEAELLLLAENKYFSEIKN
ncbi:MAG: hypothetical protein IJ346_01390 [Clostridia bacterium]|nr:hypothetical protein [Clostridia bacterium]